MSDVGPITPLTGKFAKKQTHINRPPSPPIKTSMYTFSCHSNSPQLFRAAPAKLPAARPDSAIQKTPIDEAYADIFPGAQEGPPLIFLCFSVRV